MPLQLRFQPFKQGERIGGCAREAADDRSVMQAADLPRVGLHHGLAHGNLPVARDDHFPIFAYRHDGGPVPNGKAARLLIVHGAAYGGEGAAAQASGDSAPRRFIWPMEYDIPFRNQPRLIDIVRCKTDHARPLNRGSICLSRPEPGRRSSGRGSPTILLTMTCW